VLAFAKVIKLPVVSLSFTNLIFLDPLFLYLKVYSARTLTDGSGMVGHVNVFKVSQSSPLPTRTHLISNTLSLHCFPLEFTDLFSALAKATTSTKRERMLLNFMMRLIVILSANVQKVFLLAFRYSRIVSERKLSSTRSSMFHPASSEVEEGMGLRS